MIPGLKSETRGIRHLVLARSGPRSRPIINLGVYEAHMGSRERRSRSWGVWMGLRCTTER